MKKILLICCIIFNFINTLTMGALATDSNKDLPKITTAPISQVSSPSFDQTNQNKLITSVVSKSNVVAATDTNPKDNDISGKPIVEDNLIVLGTGAVTGVYYPAGGAVCRLINKERKRLGIRCAVESTPGSIYNIDSLRIAEIEFAFIQSDWQEHAYNGTGIFTPKGRFDNLRFVFSLHNEALTLIVPKSSDINKFDDIIGHVVNIGADGSGVRATIEDIMKAKNWTVNSFKSLTELKPSEQSKALCNGSIDAMFIASGHPNGLIEDVANMCEIKIININDDIISKFIAGNPDFSATIIPAGLYKGVDYDVKTLGVKATLVTSTDTSDDIVYNVTKTIFDNLEVFKSLHPVFVNLQKEEMINEGRIVPFHNGALKYYKEQNLIQN